MAAIDLSACVKNWAYCSYITNYKSKANPNDLRCAVSWERIKCKGDIKWRITDNRTSPQVIYRGLYINSTDAEATHKIRFDAETDAIYTIGFEKGHTKNLPVVPTIKLPDEVTTNVFGYSINLDTNVTSPTNTEKIKWTMDSEVASQPRTKLEATVQVIGQSLTGTFEGKVFLEGTIVVTVVDTVRNTTTVVQNDICDIVAHDKSRTLKKANAGLSWEVRGSIKMEFGIKHEMKLREEVSG